MDIKSKNLKYNIWFKVVAWALCLAGVCLAAWAMLGLYQNHWAGGSYLKSNDYQDTMQSDLSLVYGAYYSTLNMQSDINQQVAELENERSDKIFSAMSDSLSAKDSTAANAMIDGINKLYDGKIQQLKDQITQGYANTQAQQMAVLANRADILYVAQENGGVVHTNVQKDDPLAYLQSLPSFTQQTYGVAAIVASDEPLASASATQSAIAETEPTAQASVAPAYAAGAALSSATAQPVPPPVPAATAKAVPSAASSFPYTVIQPSYDGSQKTMILSVAMPQSVFEQHQSDYQTRAQTSGSYLAWLLAGLIAFAAGFVWLLYAAGRRPEGGDVLVGWSDKIPLDVGFVLALAAAAVSFALMNRIPSTIDPSNSWVVAWAAIGAVLLNLWFTSLSRRIKRREAGRYTVSYMIFGGLHSLYKQSGASAKVIWLMVLWLVGALFCAGVFAIGVHNGWMGGIIGLLLLAIFVGLTLWFLLKKAADIKTILSGLKRIREGDLDYTIAVRDQAELGQIAEGVNNIADGFQSVVKKEVRAERMKTELITNISHDLKTPLTSIIAYIDLLKKEELPGENAQKYMEVLETKANRLKALTEDLFEAAKAASGDITVNMDKIELVQFMQQVLGEMGDKIRESGLIFVNDIPDDKMYVCADGRLLWRVMGNVLDNVLKYALEGSRVYIDVKKTLKAVSITVKNISRDSLNMPADELMERFQRGDASRHTEGSGLGLAIARDLMRIMGCEFEIGIDGDLFKVIMRFPDA